MSPNQPGSARISQDQPRSEAPDQPGCRAVMRRRSARMASSASNAVHWGEDNDHWGTYCAQRGTYVRSSARCEKVLMAYVRAHMRDTQRRRCVHTYVQVRTYVRRFTNVRTHACTSVRTYVHAYVRTLAFTRTYVRTYVRT